MAITQLTDEQIRTWTRAQKDRWWFENVYRGDMRGTPVYLKNLGTVQIGGAIRRGLLEMNGEGGRRLAALW